MKSNAPTFVHILCNNEAVICVYPMYFGRLQSCDLLYVLTAVKKDVVLSAVVRRQGGVMDGS